MASVRLDDVPIVQTEDGRWQALNGPLGLTGFGINAFNTNRDEDTDSAHDETESQQQELYIVVSGRALITVGGEQQEAGVGTLVSAPDPSAVRSFRALEDGTRIVCIGAAPGTGEEGYGSWIVPV
jgi:mannose-6-phosphate isomerase-like protein (cupin superfamily)